MTPSLVNLPESSQELTSIAGRALDTAAKLGADQAEVALSRNAGSSVTARMRETETVEYNHDSSLTISVYFGQRLGSASSGDLSEKSIEDAVKAACSIASYTGRDECFGLAEPELMATEFPDLDLNHPWGIEIPDSLDIAKECEAAALDSDARIVNSEGAQVSTHLGQELYANSHGFVGYRAGSRHSVSVSVIAAQGDEMQRGYWYTSERDPDSLQPAADVGRIAARRTLERLGSRQIPTEQVPVLFEAPVASSLVSHFIAAIRGAVLYKKASFLVDKIGESVFPEHIVVEERPQLVGGNASASFDQEGVATPAARLLVDAGVLQGYVLGSYTARKLGMQTTANAGGVRNLLVRSGARNMEELLKAMERGFLVTELIGSGINLVTGDYSRGAAGFWVENGEIQFPVEEVTVAGNLRDMFLDVAEVGADIDTRGNIHCGSILLNKLTVAGST